MPFAIPPDLESELLAKAASGHTTRQLSAWLLEAHAVDASHAAVARLLAKHRDARADIAKSVVRENLARTLTTDLDVLAKHVAKLDALADRSADGEPEFYLKAVEQLRKLVDTRLHYAGADQPDTQSDELASLGERAARRLLLAIASSDEESALGDAEREGEGGA
jgi:hypothetical protein